MFVTMISQQPLRYVDMYVAIRVVTFVVDF
jgi:hypothetical protein